MKLRALIIVPLCCDKGKNTVLGTRGGLKQGRQIDLDDKEIVWTCGESGSPWNPVEITYCPHCATPLPSEIQDAEVS